MDLVIYRWFVWAFIFAGVLQFGLLVLTNAWEYSWTLAWQATNIIGMYLLYRHLQRQRQNQHIPTHSLDDPSYLFKEKPEV